MRRAFVLSIIIVLICALASLATGCASSGSTPTLGDAQIAPPTIKEEGKLYVGIDHASLPYSAEVDGEEQGLDVEVASLVAGDLGLKVEFVEVAHDEAAFAIQSGKIDVMMSMVLGDIDPSIIAVSGVYAQQAPALFSLKDTSLTKSQKKLKDIAIGVQGGTSIESEVKQKGATDVIPYDSLSTAFEDMTDDTIDAVVCDAIVGSYLCSLYPDVEFKEQLRSADLVGIGVAAENVDLQQAVQTVIDKAKEDGRLELLKAHWVGEMPELSFDTSATPSVDTSSSEGTSTP